MIQTRTWQMELGNCEGVHSDKQNNRMSFQMLKDVGVQVVLVV